MLSWGQKAAIDGGMSLESAILVSWDTAKQLFQGKRGHEAAVMRATVKALEALNTLESCLKDCGVEVDRLVAAKLGGKGGEEAHRCCFCPAGFGRRRAAARCCGTSAS